MVWSNVSPQNGRSASTSPSSDEDAAGAELLSLLEATGVELLAPNTLGSRGSKGRPPASWLGVEVVTAWHAGCPSILEAKL